MYNNDYCIWNIIWFTHLPILLVPWFKIYILLLSLLLIIMNGQINDDGDLKKIFDLLLFTSNNDLFICLNKN